MRVSSRPCPPTSHTPEGSTAGIARGVSTLASCVSSRDIVLASCERGLSLARAAADSPAHRQGRRTREAEKKEARREKEQEQVEEEEPRTNQA
eukprot:2564470-Rhodomonas_salina.3